MIWHIWSMMSMVYSPYSRPAPADAVDMLMPLSAGLLELQGQASLRGRRSGREEALAGLLPELRGI